MSLPSEILTRLRALLFHAREDRELAEELQYHLDRDTEERARRGSPAPRREALLALGGVDRVTEDVRVARGIAPLEDLAADLRYAVRGLRRGPGFAVAVVAVLGLGIGAATTVFAVAQGVLLADLPYERPSELVRVYQHHEPDDYWTLSMVDVLAIRDQQRSFTAFGALQPGSAALTGSGDPEFVRVGRATSGFFAALGVRAAVGRLPTPADDQPGAAAVVVVTHAMAVRLFGTPAAASGRSLTLDGVAHTVIGVLEPGRHDLAGWEAEAWPVRQLIVPERRGPFGLRGFGRLRPGVSLAQATSDLASISERIFPLWAASFQDREARLTPLPLERAIVGNAGREVGLFAGGVLLVLLVALTNVATLQLIRVSARDQEVALRTALGAKRGRLVRLLLTEGAVLTALAGAVAVAVAFLGVRLVADAAPDLPRLAEVRLGGPALLFALLVTLVSGLAVSAVPLVSLFRGLAPQSGLHLSSRRASAGRRATRLRTAMVVAEFALVLPLLVGAGVLLNSFVRLQRVDLGYDPRGVAAASVSLPSSRYTDPVVVARFWDDAERRARLRDGVTAAGVAGSLPPNNFGDVNNFDLLDKPVPPGASQPVAPWPSVSNGYFAVLGVPLLAGRLFEPGDSLDAPPVVIVSQSWAARWYPGESAVGRQLRSGGCTDCPPTTVVGVVGDVLFQGLTGARDAVYVPVAQAPGLSLAVLVRSSAPAAATLAGLREVVRSLDADLPSRSSLLEDRVNRELGDPMRWTMIVGAFAAAGVLLAAIGIFGLMSYGVWLRRRELGVHVALGAAPSSLMRAVLRRGLGHAALGTLIGLAITGLERRWLGSLLYGVTATDPATIAVACLLVLTVAAVACLVPGLRAARINPADVLGAE